MAAPAAVPRKPAQAASVFRIADVVGSDEYFSLRHGLVRDGIVAKLSRAQIILLLGVVEQLTFELRHGSTSEDVVVDVEELAIWSGDSSKEMTRAAKELAKSGLVPSEMVARGKYKFRFCPDRFDALKDRQPRYGYVAPPKPEPEPDSAPAKAATPKPQPIELDCPLGEKCPVDRVRTRNDGVLVNFPPPGTGVRSSEADTRFVQDKGLFPISRTLVSTSGDLKGRTTGERSRTPVSSSPTVHPPQVNEEKAKIDRMLRDATDGDIANVGELEYVADLEARCEMKEPEIRDQAKWTALRDWMAHEGRKRGRCGVSPTDDEVARVLTELAAGTVAELADYAAHKIHFMHRYNWLLPFARTVAKRAAAHGNGNGRGSPAAAAKEELIVPRDADGNPVPWPTEWSP